MEGAGLVEPERFGHGAGGGNLACSFLKVLAVQLATELEHQLDTSFGATFVEASDCGDDHDGDGLVCGDADDSPLPPSSQDACTTPDGCPPNP